MRLCSCKREAALPARNVAWACANDTAHSRCDGSMRKPGRTRCSRLGRNRASGTRKRKQTGRAVGLKLLGVGRARPLECPWSSDDWFSTSEAPAGHPGRSTGRVSGIIPDPRQQLLDGRGVDLGIEITGQLDRTQLSVPIPRHLLRPASTRIIRPSTLSQFASGPWRCSIAPGCRSASSPLASRPSCRVRL